jgi:thioesterase domain-containing protein/acyl carrier protein
VEPATPTEKRLAALWEQTLGLPPASATANFFESGGDSLRATQLIAQIQREFGRDFPFALFLRAPSIAQIARVLDMDAAAIADPGLTGGAVLSHPHRGGRLPLFCITSNAHDLYVFRHLTNHLDRGQPVFVLNVPVRQGEQTPTVEALAARVCQSIHGIRPEGPYILGGYCFGGMLAFEAARQLIAGGAEVPLVAVFDTPAPGYPRLLGSRRMAAYVQAAGWRTKKEAPSAGVIAARMYVPQPIQADLAQFMAQDQPVSSRILEDPRLAWRNLCTGHFQVYLIPGDHVTWLQEPNAKTAALRLTEALQRHTRLTATASL